MQVEVGDLCDFFNHQCDPVGPTWWQHCQYNQLSFEEAISGLSWHYHLIDIRDMLAPWQRIDI